MMAASNPELAGLAARESVPGAPRLDATSLRGALTNLGGWELRNDTLEKSFRFDSYADTIAFVNAVAWIAQRLDHHPDLEVGYGRCKVVWTTHDAKGVTMNDCIAAARTEQLLG
jgi:4a-hydroxytetrahydrobiopterin dehydratase